MTPLKNRVQPDRIAIEEGAQRRRDRGQLFVDLRALALKRLRITSFAELCCACGTQSFILPVTNDTFYKRALRAARMSTPARHEATSVGADSLTFVQRGLLSGHTKAVSSLKYSPDGSTIASGCK
jgi:hypothetical protein